MENFTDRRQFIKTTSAAMLMSSIPIGIGDVDGDSHMDQAECLLALIEAYIEDHEKLSYLGCREFNEEEIDRIWMNLMHSFKAIKPKHYDEYFFVTACGWNGAHLAEEYVRRRNGEPSLLPDHPMFSLNWRLWPETQRILIYAEQLDDLLKVLLEPQNENARSYKTLLHRNEMDFQLFSTRMTEKYKSILSQEEKKIIYDGIAYYHVYARSYITVSSIVNHAFKKLNVQFAMKTG